MCFFDAVKGGQRTTFRVCIKNLFVICLNCLLLACITARFVLLKTDRYFQTATSGFKSFCESLLGFRAFCILSLGCIVSFFWKWFECIQEGLWRHSIGRPFFFKIGLKKEAKGRPFFWYPTGFLNTFKKWCIVWLSGSLISNLVSLIQPWSVWFVGFRDLPTTDSSAVMNLFSCITSQAAWVCINVWFFQYAFKCGFDRLRRHRNIHYGYNNHVRRGCHKHPCTVHRCVAASPNICISRRRLGNNGLVFYRSRKFCQNFGHHYPHDFTHHHFHKWLVNWIGIFSCMMIYPAISFAVAWYDKCALGPGRGIDRNVHHCRSYWRARGFRIISKFLGWFHWVRPPKLMKAVDNFLSGCYWGQLVGSFDVMWCKFKLILTTHHTRCPKNERKIHPSEQVWMWGLRGVRVGEAKNPGPSSPGK